MSLSAWEQDVLDSIKDRLASSDPTLVARLNIFARLASGEEMPAREKIPVGSRAVRRSRPGDTRPGLSQAALLLWLVTTFALIAVALTSNRGSQGTCTGTWATLCTDTTSASSAQGLPSNREQLPGLPLGLALADEQQEGKAAFLGYRLRDVT